MMVVSAAAGAQTIERTIYKAGAWVRVECPASAEKMGELDPTKCRELEMHRWREGIIGPWTGDQSTKGAKRRDGSELSHATKEMMLTLDLERGREQVANERQVGMRIEEVHIDAEQREGKNESGQGWIAGWAIEAARAMRGESRHERRERLAMMLERHLQWLERGLEENDTMRTVCRTGRQVVCLRYERRSAESETVRKYTLFEEGDLGSRFRENIGWIRCEREHKCRERAKEARTRIGKVYLYDERGRELARPTRR